MKQIRIIKLTLRNFKGIHDLTIDFNGADSSIFGDNGTGKTTISDAWHWLLFDKDSANRKDFEIKTLDAAGRTIHNLEHEVEGVLQVDGRRKTLRKVFTEKWTKRRGSATSEFTGHTTDYFVDGVPVKKNEYDDAVDAIVSEHLFKLLTNPAYFHEQLKWQDRRKILLDVCGDVTDEDVIGSNKALAKLPSILVDHSMEEYRKIIDARKKKINGELQDIPVRIAEVARMKPDTSGLDRASMEHTLETLRAEIEDKQAQLSRIQNGGEVAVKEKQLRELEGELLQLKNELQSGTMDKLSAKRQEVAGLRNELEAARMDRKRIADNISYNMEIIKRNEDEAARLRQQWMDINAEAFHHHHHDDNCPACGQALPAEKIAAAHEKALSAFNLDKARRLEQISTKGKAAAAEAKRLQGENASLSHEIESADKSLAAKETQVADAERELSALQETVTDVAEEPRYIAKQEQIAAIRREIASLRSSAQGALEDARLALARLRTELELQQKSLAAFEQVEKANARIAELEAQERALAKEYEALEQETFLIEEFVRTKVGMLEQRINSKFRFVRFKLFNILVNGALEECCVAMYNGVPYEGGLNNGARINAGLDVISTLSEHFEVTAPIFVDNAESVTNLIETKGQQIRLVVSAADKQIRIEIDPNLREAV